MTTHKRIYAAAGVAMTLVLAACSSGTSTSGGSDSSATSTAPAAASAPNGAGKKICAIILTSEIEYFATLLKEYQTAGQAAGADVIALDSKGDPANQSNQFDDCVAKGVDAIIATPVDPATTKVAAQAAMDKGIPVIIQGEELVDVDWATANVGYSEEEMGKYVGQLCAECLVKRYPDVKKFQIVSCTYPALPATVRRMDTAEKELRDQLKAAGKDVEFVSKQACGTRDTADKVVSAALAGNKDLQGVLNVNDASSIGAVSAFSAAGDDPTTKCITGPNNDVEVRQYIKDGQVYATVNLDAPSLASKAIAVALDAAAGKTVEKMTYVPMAPVTVDNVGQFPLS